MMTCNTLYKILKVTSQKKPVKPYGINIQICFQSQSLCSLFPSLPLPLSLSPPPSHSYFFIVKAKSTKPGHSGVPEKLSGTEKRKTGTVPSKLDVCDPHSRSVTPDHTGCDP